MLSNRAPSAARLVAKIRRYTCWTHYADIYFGRDARSIIGACRGDIERDSQRTRDFGWSAVEMRVALTYAAVWVIALSAWQAGRPDPIRSPRLVLAHVWERVEV